MSNEIGNLSAQLRDRSGKGVARKLRDAGRIPAVVYGQGGDNIKVSINPLELRAHMDPARKLNTFWSIALQDEAGKDSGSEKCIIVEFVNHQQSILQVNREFNTVTSEAHV